MPTEQAIRTIQSLVSRRKPTTMEDSTGLSDCATQTLWTGMLHPLLRLGQFVFALPHHPHVSSHSSDIVVSRGPLLWDSL